MDDIAALAVSPAKAAALLGVSRSKLYELLNQEIPALKLGRRSTRARSRHRALSQFSVQERTVMLRDHMRHHSHDLQSHSIAYAFPMLAGTEFAELVADIKANGVREPIVLHEGKILDGRNRYRAAQAAGVECPCTEYQGTDPIKYVVSLNLRRRHLDESQRAWVAANLTKLKDGERPSQICEPAVTRERAAEMLNVSPRSIDSARVVRDHGTIELQDKVAAGMVSVSAAADVARLLESEQREIVAKAMRRSRRLRSGSGRSGPGRQSASVEPGKRSIRNAPKERKINGRRNDSAPQTEPNLSGGSGEMH